MVGIGKEMPDKNPRNGEPCSCCKHIKFKDWSYHDTFNDCGVCISCLEEREKAMNTKIQEL